MDWQTLFALVEENCEKVVPIEMASGLCYVYQTRKKGFPFRNVVYCQKKAFAANELEEIVTFLKKYGYHPEVQNALTEAEKIGIK
ncbi:hypothetical protein [Enterococcus mediterraneensis]|uniref:hypothetical protein n=1 Tax=Enterococcus mediterraneensis TaxID=2364791 RepID=UPI000F06148D|nr:hypothetical protein [Enterococcus mediterraneensis]